MENTFFSELENIKASTEITKSGEVEFYSVDVEVKDENGNKTIVAKKLRNPVAVASMVSIEQMLYIRSRSQKALVLAMSKLNIEHAKSIGLKSVKALLRSRFGKELSDNTIDKYRRIGIIFANNREDVNDFSYREEIESDVSVSNLDVVMTLFNLKERDINLEELTQSEVDKLFNEFYEKYIVTDMIHLSKSQAELKKEVHDILNPAIDVEAREIDEGEEESTKSETSEETTTSEEEVTPEMEKAETIAEYTRSLQSMLVFFKGNGKAEKAIATIVSELAKM